MRIAEDAVSLLQSSGYKAEARPEGSVVAEFEDAAVFGFVALYESTDELLRRWKADHDDYIRRRVQQIRAAVEKRSNMYAVFVTGGPAQPDHLREIVAIEENFVASRKIVGTAVTLREHLRSVLLPLLPLQSTARITDADLAKRLQRRLEGRPSLYEQLMAATDAENLVNRVLGE